MSDRIVRKKMSSSDVDAKITTHTAVLDAHIAADPFGHFASLFIGTNLMFHRLLWDRTAETKTGSAYCDMNAAMNGAYIATGDTANSQIRRYRLIKGAGRGGKDRFNFGKSYIISFSYLRSVGNNANGVGFIQIKSATTHGILAAIGVGIRVENLTLYGEAHDGTTYTSHNLNTALILQQETDVLIYSDGDTFVKWYVNGVLKATQTVNIPKSAPNNMNCVASIDNGATAANTEQHMSDILLICKKA